LPLYREGQQVTNPRYRAAPVVALTANAFAAGEANGCFNDCLTKPIEPDLIAKCLKAWLRRA